MNSTNVAIGKELNCFAEVAIVYQLLNPALLYESNSKIIEIEVKDDKGVCFYEVSSHNIMYGNRELSLTIIKDITLKKEETRILLQRSETLALLGQMAAGIAHEIRNTLTFVLGFIQLLQVIQHEKQYIDIVQSELD